MTRLDEIRARADAATEGPWELWEGPSYVGGGADLCIGRGEEWLGNMNNRKPRCPQILEDGHFDESCDICVIDSGLITDEQRANGTFLAASREDVPWLLERVAELVAALKDAEWACFRQNETECPVCGFEERLARHDSECPVGKALASI